MQNKKVGWLAYSLANGDHFVLLGYGRVVSEKLCVYMCVCLARITEHAPVYSPFLFHDPMASQ